MSGPAWVAFALVAASIIFGVGLAVQDCEEHDGTLVRGMFWFACVEKGKS